MSQWEKSEFQKMVLGELRAQRRRAFRAPIAARIELAATAPNPPHLYSAVKNVLDLFGRPLDKSCRPRGLVYGDDRQVWVLSVSYRVRADNPGVRATFAPLRSYIDDIELAGDILFGHVRGNANIEDYHHERNPGPEAISDYLDLERDDFWSSSDTSFDSLALMKKRDAQVALLNHSKIGIRELHTLYTEARMLARYPLSLHPTIVEINKEIAADIRNSPLRLRLPPPPRRSGETTQFKEDVHESLSRFEGLFSNVLRPLVTPVRLQVAYRPPEGVTEPERDLDNLVKYILSAFHDYFKPPGNLHRALYSFDDPKAHRKRLPPKSIEYSVIGIEVFRLARPVSDSRDGFLLMGIVPDKIGTADLWRWSDEAIEKWGEQLERW